MTQWVEIWNVVSRIILLNVRMRRYSVLWVLFAMEDVKLETQHQILIDFYRQNLVNGNTYTRGLLRTTGLPWSKQCMQGVTKLSPSMLCSTGSTPKSAKSTDKLSSIFLLDQRQNLRLIDPIWHSNKLIFTAFWLLPIYNNNIFAFQPYFGQILSILNSYQLFYWTCAKFPAQGVRSSPKRFPKRSGS